MILPNGYAQRQLAITSSAVTGGAEVEFTPTPDIFTYARYGRGYASPSFNAGIVSAAPEVAPEFLNSYEIGYKQSFGRNLLIDMAAFYYDYDDFQLPISINNNGGHSRRQFVNVPKARSDGHRVRRLLDAGQRPEHHAQLLVRRHGGADRLQRRRQRRRPDAGAGRALPARHQRPGALATGARPVPGQVFNATTNPGIDQTVKGDPLPDAPRNKVAVSGAYTWHYDPGDLTLSAAYVWRDQQAGTVFNRWYDNAPAWSDVDIRALWKGPHDHYEVIGYVKNVFNTLQYTVGAGGVGLLGNSMAATSAATGSSSRTCSS